LLTQVILTFLVFYHKERKRIDKEKDGAKRQHPCVLLKDTKKALNIKEKQFQN